MEDTNTPEGSQTPAPENTEAKTEETSTPTEQSA